MLIMVQFTKIKKMKNVAILICGYENSGRLSDRGRRDDP